MSRNMVIDRIRRSKVVGFGRILEIKDFDIADDAPDRHRIIAGRQSVAALERALADLPEPCRIAFIRCRMDSQSPRQIAKELGVSLSALEKRLARAIQSLAAALDIPLTGKQKRAHRSVDSPPSPHRTNFS